MGTATRKTRKQSLRKKSPRKQSSCKKLYQTHSNGGRPFAVDIQPSGQRLTIYKQSWDEQLGWTPSKSPLYSTHYHNIWIGVDVLNLRHNPKKWPGNSILAQLNRSTFLHVGEQVFTFALEKGDTPVLYESYVGNSDVPYPYLIGKKYTYFLLETGGVGVLENSWLDLKDDAYAQFYGHTPGPRGTIPKSATQLRPYKKLIHKRYNGETQ